MSAIDCYVTQFARRCLKVLTSCEQTAQAKDCEVTLMLMVASAGIVVPYERLDAKRLDSHEKLAQPTNDQVHYPADVEKMKDLLDGSFIGSAIWKKENHTWKSGELACLMEARNKEKLPPDKWPRPGDWHELNTPILMDGNVTVRDVVGCIRHALAHGNIYLDPDLEGNIKTIVFAAGRGTQSGINKDGKPTGNPFRFVSVSVADFRQFLESWFKWLKTLPMGAKFFPEHEEDYILSFAA